MPHPFSDLAEGAPRKKPTDILVTAVNVLQIVAAIAMALEAIIRFSSFISSLRGNIKKHHIGFAPGKKRK